MSEPSAIVGLRIEGDKLILSGIVSPDMQFVDFEPDKNIKVPPGNYQEINVDLNNDANFDFRFEVSYFVGTSFNFYDSKITNFNPENNKVIIGPLEGSEPISINSEGWVSSSSGFLASLGAYPCSGPWCTNNEPRYMGFKFCSENDTTLYWLKMKASYNEITLYEYAYLNFTPSGINKHKLDFQILPNPTSGLITIKTNFPENMMSFSIYNVQGIKMDEMKFTSVLDPIDLSKLPNGIYMFQLNFRDGQSAFSKIVKR